MQLIHASIKNFRLLQESNLSFDPISTVIVGRNNTGKTSLSELFSRFAGVGKLSFKLEDFSVSTIPNFKLAYDHYKIDPTDVKIRDLLPRIQLTTTFDYTNDLPNFGLISDFIIDLNENCRTIKVEMTYKLKDGSIGAFLSQLNPESPVLFFRSLQDEVPKHYVGEIVAVDPTDETNQVVVDFNKLNRVLSLDFIHAQRGLDDETLKEHDYLGDLLAKIFKSGENEFAPESLKTTTEELNAIVKEIQNDLNIDFKNKLHGLIPALNIFGYPGLSDPKLTIEMSINAERILESSTLIKYDKGNAISLPETYNGLGSRNLIYILFQLFSYFRKYQSNPTPPKCHIVYIEEPEAHLHPQMQEVFIRKLDEIAREFSKTLNKGVAWPVQFVVSTHSTHIANEAHFSSIRYFMTKLDENGESRTNIKDFQSEFNAVELKEDREFIHKYLTLTKCDLFFADKAIMFEGPTERILMPEFIKKTDVKYKSSLSSQYISRIEIGGAYAHHFYKFLDFLGIKTVLVTDIDSVVKDSISSRYIASVVSLGTRTSNAGLLKWFEVPGDSTEVSLADLLTKTEDEKIRGKVRVAYQVAESGGSVVGRSFEEAFILANPIMFGIDVKESSELEVSVSDCAAQEANNGKTNFALKYAIEKSDWVVPRYIEESLLWLAE